MINCRFDIIRAELSPLILSSSHSAFPDFLFTASAACKACVDAQECLKCRAMTAKNQFQTAACLHQPSSQIHEFLNHGFDSTPFCLVAHRGVSTDKPDLFNEAQDIVGQASKGQNQGIGGEFARREPFHVQIGLDFAMELLACSMVFVETD